MEAIRKVSTPGVEPLSPPAATVQERKPGTDRSAPGSRGQWFLARLRWLQSCFGGGCLGGCALDLRTCQPNRFLVEWMCTLPLLHPLTPE